MRVYLPTTLDGLRRLVENGEVPAGTERILAEDESEDAEYLALMTAADVSAGLGGTRRVVVVADVEDVTEPDGPITAERVVAVHADAADRDAGADPDEEPGWYATQEIPDLLA